MTGMRTLTRREELAIRLDPAPISARVAREMITGALESWGLPGYVDAVTLVASELVTNAVRHATPPDGTTEWHVLLRLVSGGNAVMCLVGDPCDQPPVLTEADFAAESGRGLHLVAGHSQRWGWARRAHHPGKWVWALFRSDMNTA